MSKSVDEKIRCTPEERETWAAAAERQGISRAEFIRRAANTSASIDFIATNVREGLPTPIEDQLDADDLAVIAEEQAEGQGRRCPHGRRAGIDWCPVCDR